MINRLRHRSESFNSSAVPPLPSSDFLRWIPRILNDAFIVLYLLIQYYS